MKAIINAVVRLIDVDEDEIQNIKQALTFRNPEYDSAARFGGRNMAYSDIPPFITMYQMEHDGIIVPRGFDWRKYNPEVIDERVSNKVKWPEPKGSLIPAQQVAVEEMEQYEEGCLVAPTASGKSRMGLYLAARLKQRLLIVAHTNLIINAWREECIKVFGINPKIYSTRNPKPEGVVMLATIQSLSRGIPPEVNRYFGMCLGDEIQHAPSPVWSTVLAAMPSKYRFGITATPTRKDKKHPMMFASIGPIRHKMHEKDVLFDDGSRLTMPLKFKTINSNFIHSLPPHVSGAEYHAMIEAQMMDEERNKLIVTAVKKEYEEGNNCLVLTLRRQHTKILTKMLRSAKVSAYRLTGQMEKEYQNSVMEGAEKNKIRCIVGTLSLIKEGTNCKRWNRLFLVSTVADRAMTEQIAGRIRRTHPEKKDAILYDVLDLKVPLLAHHFWTHRYGVYSRLSKA